MRSGDTIVALSSGAPPSGVAVIRLSGPDVRAILQDIAGDAARAAAADAAAHRPATRCSTAALSPGFPAPHSFTGEDCAELQVHGSPAGVRAILKLITSPGRAPGGSR